MRDFLKLNFTDYEENYDRVKARQIMNKIQAKEQPDLNNLFNKPVEQQIFYDKLKHVNDGYQPEKDSVEDADLRKATQDYYGSNLKSMQNTRFIVYFQPSVIFLFNDYITIERANAFSKYI